MCVRGKGAFVCVRGKGAFVCVRAYAFCVRASAFVRFMRSTYCVQHNQDLIVGVGGFFSGFRLSRVNKPVDM